MKNVSAENLVMMFKKSAERFSDKTALFFSDKKISYKELYQMSQGLSQGLKNLGIKKGDKVAIFLHNTPEFVAAYFAIISIEAVCVPVNNMLKERRSLVLS